MRFYGETLKSTMNTQANIFFSLLNESYRLEAKEYIAQVNIVSIPHMSEDARRTFGNRLEEMSKDHLDIGIENTDYSSLAKLKKILN